MPHENNSQRKSKSLGGEPFAAIIRDFMSPLNPKWAAYAKATRDLWGRELRLAQHPDTLGGVSALMMRPALVDGFLDGLADRPAKQEAALAALRQLDKWAVKRDRLRASITFGVEVEGSDGGHTPWADEHVEIVERFGRPDIALAVTLGANTGQRGSDLVRMAVNDLEEYGGHLGINVRQKKTGKVIWVPFTRPMLDAWERWPYKVGLLLRKPDGSPWTRAALTQAWAYHREGNEALAPLKAAELHSRHDQGLVIHGLRGTACVRLSRAGCTTRQIADMVGMSEPMVAKYCRFSLQRENALAAVTMLDRTTRERLIEKRNKGVA